MQFHINIFKLFMLNIILNSTDEISQTILLQH